ncbi:MAG: hypothetical protein M3401_15705 [Actinomycetota bacterium]|nr:hypothetical protein [Actinomycetota bacterium]
MIAWRPFAILIGCALFLTALVFGAGMMTGTDGLREMWAEIRPYAIAAAAIALLSLAAVVAMVVTRLRARKRREMARYQLVLGQADEATHDEVAAAAEALVQALRSTLVERVAGGQPWLAIESWHVAPSTPGETGNALLMVLCEPVTLEPALAALRRAYPNLTVRCDPETGEPRRYDAPRFEAAHVLRVRKARDWVLPVGASSANSDHSNARSVMATVIRQQQKVGKDGLVSCVRWCLQPADESVDALAARRLRRMADSTQQHNSAVSADVVEAQRSGGGALCFVELQSAIQSAPGSRPARYGDLQAVCRLLVSPALSMRGVNTFIERQMVIRQRLYRQRWARATPPILPDQTGATLWFTGELGLFIELPSLGSEHDLPLLRNTVPYLPAPAALPRGQHRGLPMPPTPEEHARGFKTRIEVTADDEELVEGELISEDA